jgi:hypothetical protein
MLRVKITLENSIPFSSSELKTVCSFCSRRSLLADFKRKFKVGIRLVLARAQLHQSNLKTESAKAKLPSKINLKCRCFLTEVVSPKGFPSSASKTQAS